MGETTGEAVHEHRSSSQHPSQHPSLPVPASDQAAPGELGCTSQKSAWACTESPRGCSAGWAIATHGVSQAISAHSFSPWRLFLSQPSSSSPSQILSLVLYPQAPGTVRARPTGSSRESKYDIFQWDGICPKPIHCHIPKSPLGCTQQWLGALLHKKSIQILSFSFFIGPTVLYGSSSVSSSSHNLYKRPVAILGFTSSSVNQGI